MEERTGSRGRAPKVDEKLTRRLGDETEPFGQASGCLGGRLERKRQWGGIPSSTRCRGVYVMRWEVRRPGLDVWQRQPKSPPTQVPVRTLYTWRYHRKGPWAHRVGRHLRYRWEDVGRGLRQLRPADDPNSRPSRPTNCQSVGCGVRVPPPEPRRRRSRAGSKRPMMLVLGFGAGRTA